MLAGNKIENIDLTPLSECTLLQNINLRMNLITTIDLSSLVKCEYLKVIDLGYNPIESLTHNLKEWIERGIVRGVIHDDLIKLPEFRWSNSED